MWMSTRQAELWDCFKVSCGMTGEIVLENGIITAYQKLSGEVPEGYRNHNEYEHKMVYQLLDETLLKHFNKSYHDFDVKKMPGGKPYFEDLPVHFNVSHCKKMVACALSADFSLGIDVENVRNVKENILKKVFSDAEISAYEKCSNKNKYFFRAWTFKESQAKLTGKGIAQDLRLIDYEDAVKTLDTEKSLKNGCITGSTFVQWFVDEDIIISLSYEKPSMKQPSVFLRTTRQ